MPVTTLSWLALMPYLVLGLLLHKALIYIYRVYFSPLARFPGPKLAAASSLFEAYYDLVLDGKYPWKIREMHAKYGPVVRVNPREIHIRDPDFYDQLYVPRLDRDPWFSNSFGVPGSALFTASFDLHRMRRTAMNRFFSKASIASRVHILENSVFKLCNALKSYAGSDEVVPLDAGFFSLTYDNIARFCWGLEENHLDMPQFNKDFKILMEKAFGPGALSRHLPLLVAIMRQLPDWFVSLFAPQVAANTTIREKIRTQVRRVAASKQTSQQRGESATESADSSDHLTASTKPTVFDQILDSNLPANEKAEERLIDEGSVLIAAGTETTARALYMAAFHLLSQPHTLARLRKELFTVMPEASATPTLQELEQLPYLTATIKEAMRVAGSVITRTARMSSSTNPMRYKDWVFPPGTPVSLTLNDLLADESVFPSPDDFDPMRWLIVSKDSSGKEVLVANTAMDKYFVPFGRGPRICIGMWLSWAEMYLTMAHVYRKFDMELFETKFEDVAAHCDRLTCFAKPGHNGVRIKVTGLRK